MSESNPKIVGYFDLNSKVKQKLLLILSLLLIIYSPLLGSLIKWDGKIPGYGDFPAVKSEIPVPGFSGIIFTIGVITELVFLILLIFPTLIGFKKPPIESNHQSSQTTIYPPWFKFGITLFLISFSIFWGKIPLVDDLLDPFMFVPVCWGIIIILDGIVYKRNEGKSLIATKPQTLTLLAIISSVGWFIFEYLNFFILENWYYPNNQVFTVYGNYVWYMVSYTVIFPFIFEFYYLFKTIPWLKDKYSYGPKISISQNQKIFFLLTGIVLSCVMGLFPHQLFFTVWLNPVIIMGAMLGLLGLWNVFTPLKHDDWSKLILIAMLLSGLIWEFNNFGSEKFYDYKPINPSYWKYSIPYVNYIHLPFSEMPILGYFGYIPYGWACWIQWSLSANLFGFDESIILNEKNIKEGY